MNSLIPLVSKLQEILAVVPGQLDLPQIAVVGAQSSGKSSVLEALVGKDFLPKGTGIVTRRPLVLQLHRVPLDPEGDGPPDFAEFLHLPDQQFSDFEEVKAEIEAETHRIAGGNKNISPQPIHLRVYSPNVVDLTLVDLPGLTKIPVGDQPSDIEAQIRDLIHTYISQPNTIILAVSPANVDLANSDALKLAREVDPHRSRTIGLLTKLDLMDRGSHAGEILAGNVYPLRLGFIGVVNRSQRDIEMRRSLDYARMREEQFFASHPVYTGIAASCCGTSVLGKTLHNILLQHIREQLPEIKSKLSSLVASKQTELARLGHPPQLSESSEKSQNALLLRLITQYAAAFTASVEGTHASNASRDLSGGARIYQVFDQVFGSALDTVDPTSHLSVREIRTAMRNATGARPALFIPEAAFDLLVKPQIARLAHPSARCVDLVYDELVRVTHESINDDLRRFPRLRARVTEAVCTLLKEHVQPAHDYVQTTIAIHRAYINTSHPDFIGGANAVAVLEKKFERERRRKETSDRVKRMSAPPGALDAAIPNGVVAAMSMRRQGGPMDSPMSVASSSTPSNKDGFLTYLFGNAATAQQGTPASMASTPPISFGLAPKPSISSLANAVASVNFSPLQQQQPLPSLQQQQQQQLQQQPTPAASLSQTTPAVHVSPASSAASAPPGIVGAADEDGAPDEAGMDGNSSLGGHPAPPALDESASHISGLSGAKLPGGTMREREDFAVQLIRVLIASYFGIVKKSLADTVPKAVMHLLVNATRDAVHTRLVQDLYQEDARELLAEDPEIVRQRLEAQKQLAVYQQALEVIAQAY